MEPHEWHSKLNKLVQSKAILSFMIDKVRENKKLQTLQQSQWDKGEDRDGQILGVYSRATEILSGGAKKEGEPFNLKDTGAFREATRLDGYLKSNGVEWDLDSEDAKTTLLETEISDKIFGLQIENESEMIDELEEIFINILERKL